VVQSFSGFPYLVSFFPFFFLSFFLLAKGTWSVSLRFREHVVGNDVITGFSGHGNTLT
jgi:hypothetical protein